MSKGFFTDTKCWRMSGEKMQFVGQRSGEDAKVFYPAPVYVPGSSSVGSPMEPDGTTANPVLGGGTLMYWFDWGWWNSGSQTKLSDSGKVFDSNGNLVLWPNTQGPDSGVGVGNGYPNSGTIGASTVYFREIGYDTSALFPYMTSGTLLTGLASTSLAGKSVSVDFKFTIRGTNSSILDRTICSINQHNTYNGTKGVALKVRISAGNMYPEVDFWDLYGVYRTMGFTNCKIPVDDEWHTVTISFPSATEASGTCALSEVAYYTALIDGASEQKQLNLTVGTCPGGSGTGLQLQGVLPHSVASGSTNVSLMLGTGAPGNSVDRNGFSVKNLSIAGWTVPFNEKPYTDNVNFLPWMSYVPPALTASMFRQSGSISIAPTSAEWTAATSMNNNRKGIGQSFPREDIRNLLANSDYSINVWASRSLLASEQGLAGYQLGSTVTSREQGTAFQIKGVNASTQLQWVVGSGSSTRVLTYAGQTTLGSWKMYTFTLKHDPVNRYWVTASFYANGSLVDTTVTSATIDTSDGRKNYYSSSLSIGSVGDEGQGSPGSPWNGRIGDFRIYSGALTDSDVLAIYSSSNWIYANDP